jgi:aquaporin PIP
MLTKKITPLRCVFYTVAQCFGAICGAGMVRIMTPGLFDKVDGGANEINRAAGATDTEALGVEFGCTFLLVMTVMAATDSVRAATVQHIPTIAPLVIGLAVTVAHFVAIPVDNCSINPARSFGVSVVSGNWNDHAVFWFGPYLGAAAASVVYTYTLEPQKEQHPIMLEDEEDEADAPAPAPAKDAAMFTGTGSAKAPEAVAVEPAVGGDLNEWK